MGRRAWAESGLDTLVAGTAHERNDSPDRYERLIADVRALRRRRHLRAAADALATVELALKRATVLDRLPDLVAAVLAGGHLAAAASAVTPLALLRAGDEAGAVALVGTYPWERRFLWRLLLAWELADDENPGAARTVLQPILSAETAVLPAQAGGRVVTLAPYAVDLTGTGAKLLSRLDDNDLGDLCRALIGDGRLDQARRVAEAMQVFPHQKLAAFASIATGEVAAERTGLAADALRHAIDLLPSVRPDELAVSLAAIAAAQARAGDTETAAATFEQAVELAAERSDPPSVMRTLAVEAAQAGFPADAAVIMTAIPDSHFAEEAAEAVSIGFTRAGEPELATMALNHVRADDVLGHRRKAVRALAVASVPADPAAALDLPGRLLRPDQRDGAYAALVPALAGAGESATARRAYDRIDRPHWRARALVDAAAAGTPLDDLPVTEAIAAAADPGHEALLLVDYAATREPEEAARLDAAAAGRAHAAGWEHRWRLLAELGTRVAERSTDRAAELFAEARQMLIDSTEDPWDEGRELWEVGRVQAKFGDRAGARETFATVVRSADPGTSRRLAPLSLAGIAIAQAKAGDQAGGHRTLQLARRAADRLPAGERSSAEPILARTLLELDEADECADLVDALLRRRPRGEHAFDHAAGTVAAACQVAPRLAEAGQPDRARALLSEVSRELAAQLGDQLRGAEALEELGLTQAGLGDVSGAEQTVRRDESRRALGPVLAACAGVVARDGDLNRAASTARSIPDPGWRARALCAVATVIADRAAPEADSLFDEAADTASEPGFDAGAVDTLIAIADAQRAGGRPDPARMSLAQARTRAAGLAPGVTRDEALVRVARVRAASGDIDGALATASDIHGPSPAGDIQSWSAGEATFWIAMHAPAADGGALDRMAAIVETITVPHWRAAGLHMLDTLRQAREQAPPESGPEVQRLLNRIPDGEPRKRLREVLVEAALLVGNHRQAIDWAAANGWPELTLRLADHFVTHDAYDDLVQLLPVCARHPETAYLVCPMLARLRPSEAAAIAAEVAAGLSDEPNEDGEDDEDGPDDEAVAVRERTRPAPGRMDEIPLSEVAEDALRDAVSHWQLGDLIDTRDILLSLRRADNSGDWRRITLHFRDAEGAAAGFAADPEHRPGGHWRGALLTATCARAIETAHEYATAGGFGSVPPGALALALVADPRSAAAQCMGVTCEKDHHRLVALIHEDLLGGVPISTGETE